MKAAAWKEEEEDGQRQSQKNVPLPRTLRTKLREAMNMHGAVDICEDRLSIELRHNEALMASNPAKIEATVNLVMKTYQKLYTLMCIQRAIEIVVDQQRTIADHKVRQLEEKRAKKRRRQYEDSVAQGANNTILSQLLKPSDFDKERESGSDDDGDDPEMVALRSRFKNIFGNPAYESRSTLPSTPKPVVITTTPSTQNPVVITTRSSSPPPSSSSRPPSPSFFPQPSMTTIPTPKPPVPSVPSVLSGPPSIAQTMKDMESYMAHQRELVEKQQHEYQRQVERQEKEYAQIAEFVAPKPKEPKKKGGILSYFSSSV